MESIAQETPAEQSPDKAPKSNLISNLGARVERRVLHTVHNGGWVVQQHANAIVSRAVQTFRRGTIITLMMLMGAALLAAAWIILNIALHSWLTTLCSLALSNLIVALTNLVVGAATLVAAAVLTSVPPPLPLPMPLRRSAARRHLARAQAAVRTETVPPPLQTVYAQPVLTAQEDNLQNALGATFELGIQAARTLPQLVRAIRNR